jgi:hypothetical protein
MWSLTGTSIQGSHWPSWRTRITTRVSGSKASAAVIPTRPKASVCVGGIAAAARRFGADRGPATDLSCTWSSPAAGTGVLAEGVDAKAPEGMPSRAMVLISARTGSGESARLPATGRVSVAGMTRAAVITARTLTP